VSIQLVLGKLENVKYVLRIGSAMFSKFLVIRGSGKTGMGFTSHLDHI